MFGDFLATRMNSDSTSVNFYLHRTFDSFSRILVESCEGMFSNCKVLTTIDNISLFDTSKVHNMNSMFYNCEALTALNLSNFDTSKVQNMASMFNGCTALKNLDLSSFDMSNVTNYDKMFNNAGITTLKCPKINPHDDIPLPRTLYSQDGTAYTNLPVTTGTSIELRQSWT
jgi:surface protein